MAVSQYAPFLDCPEIIKEFLDYIQTVRGRSAKTVDGYYIDLRTFFRWLKLTRARTKKITKELLADTEILDLSSEAILTITLGEVYSYLTFVKNDLSNGEAAMARKVTALKTLYKYLSGNANYIQNNPLKNLDLPTKKKSLPRYLTLDQSIALLSTADNNPNPRNYCILTLFLNCGMRLSELIGINLTDIQDDTIKILGKGNKERMVYLNDACKSAIDQYLTYTQGHKRLDGALFISTSGKRLSPRRVEQIVDEALKAAGIDAKAYSPHKLRHTAATLMYQHGGTDIRVLKEILGHSNLATTEIYTHTSNEQVRVAVKNSPLSSITSSKGKKSTNGEEQ